MADGAERAVVLAGIPAVYTFPFTLSPDRMIDVPARQRGCMYSRSSCHARERT